MEKEDADPGFAPLHDRPKRGDSTPSLETRSDRLARGWAYEPPTFYEVNEAAAAQPRRRAFTRCQSVRSDTTDAALCDPVVATGTRTT